MPPFSSLFPELPPAPLGATWLELQAVEIARDQAKWSHVSIWVQVAGLIAACVAAGFAWQAARASRRQADAAQQEIAHLGGARDAESRLRAWELRALMQKWFTSPPRKVADEALPERIAKITKSDDTGHSQALTRTSWTEIGTSGFHLAVGINSSRVIPLWTALMDCGAVLQTLRVTMAANRQSFALREINKEGGLGFLVREEELNLEWAKQSDEVPVARAEYEKFWSLHRQLFAEVDCIARVGNLSREMPVSASSVGAITPEA